MRLFHRHNWIKKKLIQEYHDYSGFKVGVFECVCDKCGKTKVRKYW